jgi:hypothetical protein
MTDPLTDLEAQLRAAYARRQRARRRAALARAGAWAAPVAAALVLLAGAGGAVVALHQDDASAPQGATVAQPGRNTTRVPSVARPVGPEQVVAPVHPGRVRGTLQRHALPDGTQLVQVEARRVEPGWRLGLWVGRRFLGALPAADAQGRAARVSTLRDGDHGVFALGRLRSADSKPPKLTKPLALGVERPPMTQVLAGAQRVGPRLLLRPLGGSGVGGRVQRHRTADGRDALEVDVTGARRDERGLAVFAGREFLGYLPPAGFGGATFGVAPLPPGVQAPFVVSREPNSRKAPTRPTNPVATTGR